MKRLKLLRKKALEAKLKSHAHRGHKGDKQPSLGDFISASMNIYKKFDDEVDYVDPVTHAICAHTLAVDYQKEKQIKALEEFERKNK